MWGAGCAACSTGAVSAHMANSPTLHTEPARPSSQHAPYTLRTRSAHALHSRAGSQPARLRGQPLARLTQLMRGHAGTSLRQIKCTLGTALPRRAPPLSPSLVAYVCIVRALPSGDARLLPMRSVRVQAPLCRTDGGRADGAALPRPSAPPPQPSPPWRFERLAPCTEMGEGEQGRWFSDVAM